MLAYVWQGIALGGAAAAQPGPFQAYLLSQTMQRGGWRTLPAALAPLLSDGPIIALVLFVLTQTPPWLLNLLQLAGGAFLLYLAYGAYRSFRNPPPLTEEKAVQGTARGVLGAALMNALSPNPYIFWTTIAGPILLAGWRETAVNGVGFLLGFYGALVGGFAGFVVLFALTKRLDPRVGRALSALSALALFTFGLYQLWQGGTAVFAVS